MVVLTPLDWTWPGPSFLERHTRIFLELSHDVAASFAAAEEAQFKTFLLRSPAISLASISPANEIGPSGRGGRRTRRPAGPWATARSASTPQ